MRVVISSKRFLPMLGGSIQYACMLGRAFHELGCEVCFLTRTSGEPHENHGLPVYRSPGRVVAGQIADWADVLLQVDASWRDVLPFLERGVPWFPSVHFGRPDKPLDVKHRVALWGLQLAFRNPNSIAVSAAAARSWGIRSEPIPNPYDDSVFHRRNARPGTERSVDVLFAGRIERSKGVFNLVHAIRALRGSSVVSCFAGDGPDLDALRHAVSAECQKSLQWQFAGRLNPEQLAGLMRNSKVLALPTTPEWIEASPLVPLEALACGCRIVASDSGGTRENVGPDSILVPPGDIAALSKGLSQSLAKGGTDRDWASIDAFLNSRKLHAAASVYLQRFEATLRKRKPRSERPALPLP